MSDETKRLREKFNEIDDQMTKDAAQKKRIKEMEENEVRLRQKSMFKTMKQEAEVDRRLNMLNAPKKSDPKWLSRSRSRIQSLMRQMISYDTKSFCDHYLTLHRGIINSQSGANKEVLSECLNVMEQYEKQPKPGEDLIDFGKASKKSKKSKKGKKKKGKKGKKGKKDGYKTISKFYI